MSDAEGHVCSPEQRRIQALEQTLREIRAYAGEMCTGSFRFALFAWFVCNKASATLGDDARPIGTPEGAAAKLASYLYRIGVSIGPRRQDAISESEFLDTVEEFVKLGGCWDGE